MLAAEALLKLCSAHGTLAVGVVLDLGRLKNLFQRDAHSFGNGCCVPDDRHILSIRRRRDSLKAMKAAASSLFCAMALCLAGLNSVPMHAQTATNAGRMEEHAHEPVPPSTSLTLTVDGRAATL